VYVLSFDWSLISLPDEPTSSLTPTEVGLPTGTLYTVGIGPSRSRRNAKKRESKQIAILEAADKANEECYSRDRNEMEM
jgi:hypothetical protein